MFVVVKLSYWLGLDYGTPRCYCLDCESIRWELGKLVGAVGRKYPLRSGRGRSLGLVVGSIILAWWVYSVADFWKSGSGVHL